MILTPEVHAERQRCYVVKAALHTVQPTGRAQCQVGADCTLPLSRRCFGPGSGSARQDRRRGKFFSGLVTHALCDPGKLTETFWELEVKGKTCYSVGQFTPRNMKSKQFLPTLHFDFNIYIIAEFHLSPLPICLFSVLLPAHEPHFPASF